MKIIIRGTEKGKSVEYSYDLYDEYDIETDTTSMARTTGYTATAVADLILNKKFENNGVCPPEHLGAIPGIYDSVVEYLRNRGIFYNLTRSGG